MKLTRFPIGRIKFFSMKPVAPNWKPISWKGAPKGKRGTLAVSVGSRVLMLVEDDSGNAVAGWYDPAADRWSKAPAPGIPFRFRPALASTGEAVLLWGGRHLGPRFFSDGAALVGNEWQKLPKKGAPSARGPHAIWTGHELLVWGGGGRKILGDGARYSLVGASWRPMSDKGAPSEREDACAIWTGRELWIYGGIDDTADGFDGDPYGDGAAYDPVQDRWRPLPDLPRAAVREPFLFPTDRGVFLVETSELKAWQIDFDGKKWKRVHLHGEPGVDGAEGFDRVRNRLVLRAPLGRAVLDLERLEWLPVPKAPVLGSLEWMTEVAHGGELIFLEGKAQKGARLELYR